MLKYFGIKDMIDILLLASIMYYAYRLVKISGTKPLFIGIASFLILWGIVDTLEMRLMGTVLKVVIDVGPILLIILFQDEIRRFLMSMGSRKGWKMLTKFIFSQNSKEKDISHITPIVFACMNMAKEKVGALIVVQEDIQLGLYEQTGEIINADISTRLIENLFFTNSPLHDGAMIIVGKKIRAAGCILPVSQNPNIPKHLGLRHRAGLGISQETDAKVIIVSEERGRIAFAQHGKLSVNITPEELQKLLVAD
ncbi:MAG TPA: TIGR00159 family protein [Bacteroidales bacterium]|nr:TIGR00159 family protein [Bacteroidales bacterium]